MKDASWSKDDDQGECPLMPLEAELLVLLQEEEGPMTRAQIVKQLGTPRTTVYDALKKLMVRKKVKRYPLYTERPGVGRPKVLFEVIAGEHVFPKHPVQALLLDALERQDVPPDTNSIARHLEIPYGTVHDHLRKLEASGMVTREGRAWKIKTRK